MKAYYLAGALILFCLSMPVVAEMGFAAPTMEDPSAVFSVSWDFGVMALGGVAAFAIGALATLAGFRVNLGAMVFAVVFVVANSLFSGTLSRLAVAPYNLPSSMATVINFAVWVVFVFAFIQLSSVPAEKD